MRATNWPEGTRVRVKISGWTGTVVKVLKATSGSGAVRVKWDPDMRKRNPYAAETSVVSNPAMNLERLRS